MRRHRLTTTDPRWTTAVAVAVDALVAEVTGGLEHATWYDNTARGSAATIGRLRGDDTTIDALCRARRVRRTAGYPPAIRIAGHWVSVLTRVDRTPGHVELAAFASDMSAARTVELWAPPAELDASAASMWVELARRDCASTDLAGRYRRDPDSWLDTLEQWPPGWLVGIDSPVPLPAP